MGNGGFVPYYDEQLLQKDLLIILIHNVKERLFKE